MGDKLKKTEEHLLRLLALRKQQGTADRARARVGGASGVGARGGRRLASATAASTAKEKAAGGGESSRGRWRGRFFFFFFTGLWAIFGK